MRRIFTAIVLCIVSLSSAFASADSITIGSGWKFRQQGMGDWIPAEVPGTVHTDLFNNGAIPDPYYGASQNELQWIDKVGWEYKCVFDAADACTKDRARLVFEGVDCFADIYLNGEELGSTENMFRTWKYDVTGKLRPEGNILLVVLNSPVFIGLQNLAEYGVNLKANNDLSTLGGLGPNKVSVYTRKSGYQYGWDLAPRYVTSGIWRPVRLESWNDATIEDMYVFTENISTKIAEMGLSVTASIVEGGDYTVRYFIGGRLAKTVPARLQAGENVLETTLQITSPRLWYPRGMGRQDMYEFSAELEKDGMTVAAKTVRTGIRTTRLVSEFDNDGKCFRLEINGKAVFCKGSNWVPADSFLPRVTREKYRQSVQAAADANMNMLRVWGGGVYEDDCFYELCDSLGIMVWQDFVFACNMYPGGDKYYSNIAAEACDNTLRLRNHPSIVLWCGNNEIDVAWKQFNRPESRFRKSYTPEEAEQYDKVNETIFMGILPDAVKSAYRQEMPYWHSTPSQGWGLDTLDRWKHGDVHNWDVWHKGVPISDYNTLIARFETEYGLQAYPEMSTIRRFAPENELFKGSSSIDSHQGDKKGDGRILQYIKELYHEPSDFEGFVRLSQLMQAEGIRTAVEAHRRNMPYCMGTLVWQFNDTWPCTSWSGIDYFGRWKALNYYLRKAYADVLISPYSHDGELDVYVVSDLQRSSKAVLDLTLMDFSGKVLRHSKKSVTLKAISSEVIYHCMVDEMLGGNDPRNAMLVIRLTYGGEETTAIHYFEKMKNIDLPVPDVEISTAKLDDGTCSVTVRTDCLAKNLTLFYDGVAGIFSDNYFDLLPGETRTVTVPSDERAEDVADKLTYITLR